MRRISLLSLLALATAMALAIPVAHGSPEARPLPRLIHEGKTGGFGITYELLPLPETSAKHTHHLTVTVTDEEGKSVPCTKVSFRVIRPDGKENRLTAKGSGNIHTTKIDLSTRGTYEILARLVVGEKAVKERFSYEVK